ncbi:MAG: hypothetical protein JST55_07410 [Bacteroidetes bacterium]|nr:hypothetical protein [Bacteroidota bacterium]
MVRIIFAVIVLIHGLIHLMGFVNQWNIKKISQFTGVTLFPVSESLSKILGIVWLITALLFVIAATGFSFGKDWWSVIGIVAIIISQLLIIIYWKDAKAGTIANSIIFITAIAAFGIYSFDKKINENVELMFSKLTNVDKRIVTKEMVSVLPPIVQKFMERSGIIGRPFVNSVRLKQKAIMRAKPDGNWMDVEAVQYFRVNEPAFVYKIKVNAAPSLIMTGMDKYESGNGNMLIKMMGLYTIGDSKGEEINRGTLIRFHSETLWFPSAVFSDYLKWEEIDEHTAKGTMTYSGITESAIFTFTNEGDVKKIEAERYGEFDGKYSKEKWCVINTSYKEFDGIRIGNNCEVTWGLKEGDFTWLKLEIKDIEYNKPFIYHE